jgi:hypothetical protein
VKPGYKTSEFFVTAVVLVATLLGTVASNLDETNAGIVAAAVTVMYTAARAFTKAYGK